MALLLIALPLALGALAWIARDRRISRAALLGTAAIFLTAVAAWWAGADRGESGGVLAAYLSVDAVGLVFLTIMALVFAAAALGSLAYFKEQGLSPRREAAYTAQLLFFAAAMSGVMLARHLALFWVLLEATTLTSALLIYFEKKKSSLEAAWKYVFICSVGIALAFVGIIILTVGSRGINSLFFAELARRAGEINPFWLKMAFAFILVGFGTKIGVAPIHAWLPDAHSEAPAPVSALLSGALLNSSFLGLVRFQAIMIRAGLGGFSDFLLILMGFLSLLVAAAFLLQTVNYKRMLAYSSIENMGILFLGLAFGPAGFLAALLHSAAHSLAKASLFLTSGEVLRLYRSKRIEDVRGLLRREPRIGWVWIVSFLAVAGFPPFPAFLSKILLIGAFFTACSGWLTGPFLALVLVIVFGLGGAVFRMAFGEPPAQAAAERSGILSYGPQVLLLILLLAIGLSIPAKILALMREAVGLLN
jgi:hydrogenase-4 component F